MHRSMLPDTHMKGNDKEYEQQTRLVATFCWYCCEKKMVEDQVKRLPQSIKLCHANGIKINCNSPLCSSCSNKPIQNKTPLKYLDSNLDAGCIPDCLQNLDRIQRRLVSQIQSYMTIIILPGGQLS